LKSVKRGKDRWYNVMMATLVGCSILFVTLTVTSNAAAQDYSGTLDIAVEGYVETNDYSLCGGELHELNIGCLNFKGTELMDWVGSFSYNGDKKVTLYGCVIDETADKFNCDSMDASPITKQKTMTLFVNESSKIPLPSVFSESSGQATDAGGSNDDDDDANPYCDEVNYTVECFDGKDYDQETGLYPCNDGSYVGDWRDCPDTSSNDDEEEASDSDDLPQEGGCQGEDDFCDADEGCRSDDVDCKDDRNFDADDYNG
jgi:hypothetical protein